MLAALLMFAVVMTLARTQSPVSRPSNSAVAAPPGTKLTAISTASPGPSAWSWMVASE